MASMDIEALRGAHVNVHNGQPLFGGAALGEFTTAAIRIFAEAAGVLDVERVDTKDLTALHNVACRKLESAYEVAQRINRKYGHSAQPARSAPLPLDPAPARISKADMLDAVKEIIDPVMAAMREMLVRHADEAVTAAVAAKHPTMLTIQMPNAEPVALGIVHEKTETIMQAVMAGLNVYLHGPAGSGKTTVARTIAEALKRPFYFAAKVESEYLLLGFRDARGETVRTQFREAYEHGGVFLFDELDGSSPAAIVALNAALANGICPFPDGTIARHPDFVCIAAGNTVLTGASRAYTGRAQLDAASIDRFAFIEFGYDERMEMALAANKEWCAHVQAVRKAVEARGINHLVTPRATFDGAKALAAGLPWATVERMCIYKGLDDETAEQLSRAAARSPAGTQAA